MRPGSPFPPLHLANRVLSLDHFGDPFAAYEALGADTKAELLKLLPEDWTFARRRVLDFGCGAGRTLRHFLVEAADTEIWGVDTDVESVQWLQRSLCPPLHAARCAADPPLEFQAGSFDLVWAISVFTHLTDASLPWLLELHRILKPGGLLIATYMGRWNSDAIAGEPWDEERIGMNVLRHSNSWDQGGPMVLMSDWWVRGHWGRAFEIVEVAPRVHNQSWALLRRRDVELTIADLERLEPDPREHRALRHNIRQLQREVEQRTADVRREYESSLSWRVTSPLRQARAALSRRRG